MDLGDTDKTIHEMKPEQKINKNIYLDTLLQIDKKNFIQSLKNNYELSDLDLKNILYRFKTEYQTIYK